MNDEIKEIKFIKYNGIEGYIELMKHDVEPLNNPECKGIELYYDGKDIKAVLDYITNLQEENDRLKNNQVKVLNRIKDFIKCSKAEIIEGNYCDTIHSQYWKMFKKFAEELKDKIKGIDTNDYVYIPKWREQELLSQEEQLEDYKSRNEKATKYIKNHTIEWVDEQFEVHNVMVDVDEYFNPEHVIWLLNGGDE